MGSVTFSHRVQNLFAQSLLRGLMLLPYRTRVRLMGEAVTRVVAPLAGWRRRIRANLALTCPEMPEDEIARIVRNVPKAVGRTLIEIYSGREFVEAVRDTPLTGPGVATLTAAQEAGEPLMLLSGHIGNYDVLRAVLYDRGYPLGALYKPMSNPVFNAHYIKAITAIGEPLFPTNRKGVAALVRHLKSGKTVGIVADVSSKTAPVLSFFGKPAHTSLSAADWSLKYKARMIPIFGLRQPDGESFEIRVFDEIPHGDPAEMMQAYNDLLEQLVRENMDQWYWTHQRWKLLPGAD